MFTLDINMVQLHFGSTAILRRTRRFRQEKPHPSDFRVDHRVKKKPLKYQCNKDKWQTSIKGKVDHCHRGTPHCV